jgi:hypothetical protein
MGDEFACSVLGVNDKGVQGWVNPVRYGNTVGLRKAVLGRLPPTP